MKKSIKITTKRIIAMMLLLSLVVATLAIPNASVQAAEKTHKAYRDGTPQGSKMTIYGGSSPVTESLFIIEQYSNSGTDYVYCSNPDVAFTPSDRTAYDLATRFSQNDINIMAIMKYYFYNVFDYGTNYYLPYYLSQVTTWRTITGVNYHLILSGGLDFNTIMTAAYNWTNQKIAEGWVGYGESYEDGTSQDVISLNVRTTGSLKLKKVSANTDMSDANSCYSIAGAVYEVRNSADTVVGTLTTDANGDTNTISVPAGTYTVKETVAPKGYALDSTIYTITVSSGGTSVLNVTDKPQSDPVDMLVSKVDADSGTNTAQGSASLEDAEFTIKYYAIDTEKYGDDVDPATKGETATRTWVFKTNEKGESKMSDPSHKVSGDELYYDSIGWVVIPLGVVTIQETKAPKGYILDDDTVYVRKVTGEGSLETVNTYVTPIVPNDIIRGGVEIEKWDYELDEKTSQGDAVLEGTEIEIINRSSNSVMVEGVEYAAGEVVKTIITNKSGVASTDADTLPYGQYEAREAQAPEGYTGDGVISRVFTIEEEGVIVKLNSADTAIKNKVIRGGVEIEKWDNEIDAKEAQGSGTLEGAVIEIINRSEKAVLVDNVLYEPGTVVMILETDADYKAVTKKDALPYGRYEANEVTPPKGYTSKGITNQKFVIEKENEIIKLNTSDTAIKNNPIRGDFELNKIFDTTGGRGAGIEFSLTSKTTGEVQYFKTDENGYYSSESSFYAHDSDEGIWFGYPETVNNDVGALLYDTYILQELRCAANEGYDLLPPIEFIVSRDMYTVKLGTLTNDKTPVPLIGTKFFEVDTENKVVTADGVKNLVDVIGYENFELDKEYEARLVVMDYETGEPIKVEGLEVGAAITFTIDSASGEIRVPISIDTTEFAGKKLVAFEEVWDITNPDEPEKVAEHKDLEDEGQTIEVEEVEEPDTPSIGTKFFEIDTESKEVIADGVKNLVDVVDYKNFELDKEYEARLVVMDYSTKQPLMINNEMVTVTVPFTIDSASGEIRVPISIDVTEHAGKTLVAYEEVWDMTNPDEPKKVAEHKDIEDEGQTIKIVKPGEKVTTPTTSNPSSSSSKSESVHTGDSAGVWIMLVLLIAAGVLIGYVVVKKRKDKVNGNNEDAAS